MSDSSFNAKTVLVTGGSSGIGRAVAGKLAEAGATVIITGRRAGALKSAAAELGPRATAIRADASDADELDELFRQIGEEHGHLDGVLVNAGGGKFATLDSVTGADIDAALATNVRGTILTIQKALPLLDRGASIVVTGSTAAAAGKPAFGLYSASKAALRALTRTWAAELAPRGIRINDIVPGPTRTPGLEGLADGDPAGLLDQVAKNTMFGRILQPGEVAAAVLFLLSDASSGMTGSELFVDAGEAQRR
jgi:NAD(P)-dependent dehydrogenase (short-subunit alcohol dehydrogenase family)